MKRPKNQDAHCQLQRRQVPQNLFEFKTILEEQSFEDSQPGERFNIRSEALQPRKLFATPFFAGSCASLAFLPIRNRVVSFPVQRLAIRAGRSQGRVSPALPCS
jgi:hypothetical protein